MARHDFMRDVDYKADPGTMVWWCRVCTNRVQLALHETPTDRDVELTIFDCPGLPGFKETFTRKVPRKEVKRRGR